jgi:signal transduction histidine kinase
VSTSLRLPYARLVIEGRMVGTHDPESAPECFALRFHDRQVGQLQVWPRRGQSHLDAGDCDAIRMVSGPLATAVHAVALTEQLVRSQHQLIATRRLERERLHRDLHDGLGPMFTGVALKADAAGNLLTADPDRAGTLLNQIAAEARLAIVEVRRIAHDLRPPTLDRNGLLESLAFEATRFTSRLDGHPLVVTTDLPPTLPVVPASISTATYRIATEALTNIARHSNASGVSMVVRVLESTDRCALTLIISDNGSSLSGTWPEGFGMASMRHRVQECGGTFEAGPGPDGGCVQVEFPLSAVHGS